MRELPGLEKLAAAHAQDLAVWGISFDQPERDKKWLGEHRQTFPTLTDAEYAVSDLYKVEGVPSAVLIDGKGVIRGYWVGELPVEEVERGLRRMTGPR